MPIFAGANYYCIPRYSIGNGSKDREQLQNILDHEKIKLFVSTYYTTVTHSKTLQVVYDLIPEILNFEIDKEPEWQEKQFAFNRADHFVCISKNTQHDLQRFFPNIQSSATEVIHCGIDQSIFRPTTNEQLLDFYRKHRILKPYFLIIGSGAGYKNAYMVVQALANIPSKNGFEILLITRSEIPRELIPAADQGILRRLQLSDRDLCNAYGGAIAMVYPSIYEGFGLPILEAMACDCPVICNNTASLPEVAGDAAIYASNPEELAIALCEVQKPIIRQKLIEAGRNRIKKFSWESTSEQLWTRITKLTSDQH
jgi:glycosyltransferase involved in cell wall biosynthesis